MFNKASEERNLLEGSIVKNLLAMSIPTMVGFLFQAAYDIIDMIWIGRISSKAVASVTIFSTIFWLVTVLNEIIGSSSVSLISQSYGKKDNDKTSLAIEQTLTFKAFVAIIAAVILFIVIKPLIYYFNNDPEVVKSALDYGYIRIFFLPIMFSSYSINTAFRCTGDARTPMIIMLITSILNVVLDPIFMFSNLPISLLGLDFTIKGMGLGIFGAALATVISVTISFIVAFIIFMKRGKVKISIKRLFKLDWAMDKKLLTIGLPSGFEVLSRNLSGVVILGMVSVYGTSAQAVMGIASKLFGFAFMPIFGLSMGASTIIGQCLGNDDLERAKATAKRTSLVAIIIMVSIGILVWIFPSKVMGIFVEESSVIKMGVPMLRILVPTIILAGASIGLAAVFPGSGHNTPLFISSFISRWGVQIPAMYIMSIVLKLPLVWLWTTYLFADMMELIVIYISYKRGKWESKRV